MPRPHAFFRLERDELMFKDGPTGKIACRIIMISLIIGMHVQFAIFVLGFGIVGYMYLSFHEHFAFDWTAFGDVRVDIRRFFEFWFIGIGIYIIYVAIHTILQLIFRRKFRFDIAASLIFAFAFLAIYVDMRRPTPRILGDLGYSMAYASLFAMIMFVTFTASTLLLDKYTKWKEYIKIPLSFVLSCLIGSLLSYGVWVALFRMFHGW